MTKEIEVSLASNAPPPTLKLEFHVTTDDLLKRVLSDSLTKDDLLDLAARFVSAANGRSAK